MFKVLTENELLHLNEQWEEEHENIPMADYEWELKRWGLIAQVQFKQTMEDFIKWGDEKCTHADVFISCGDKKRECLLCWQELKEE